MERVTRVIKDICNESHCRNCALSNKGICKAKDIIKLFNKYWEEDK